ncbi:MAG: WD40 repeat domain-containing protein [Methanoregula sp.]|jgi:hypothetical protein|nr:WD40 repeat domain-containing protein [Methanoregula sp.]
MKHLHKRFVIILILLLAVMISSVNATEFQNPPVPVWWHWMGSKEVIVACSDDCTSIAAGSDTGMFRMYDRTGTILWTYPIEGKPVTSVAISGDGRFAVAAFSTPHEGDIVYFNREGTLLWKYRSDAVVPRKVAMSKDGTIIVASSDKDVSVFNSKGVMTAHTSMTEDVCRVVMSEDGAMTAVASHPYCAWRGMDGTISSMNQNGTIRFQVPINLSFTDVAISAHGERIAGVDDSKLYVFTGNGIHLWNFSSNPRFRSVAISSDGDDIAAGSQYFVRFFNRTGALLWDYYDEKGWVNMVSMSGDGDFIFAGSSNKLLLFDRTGTLLWKYSIPTEVTRVSASKDGNYFTAGTNDRIYLFNRGGEATGIATNPYVIIINPITTHVKNESFTISGTTNLPPGDKLLIEVVLQNLMLGPKGTDYSGAVGVVKVHESLEGKNIWSFTVNSSDLKPENYLVVVTSYKYGTSDNTSFSLSSDENSNQSSIFPKAAPNPANIPTRAALIPAGIIIGSLLYATFLIIRRYER